MNTEKKLERPTNIFLKLSGMEISFFLPFVLVYELKMPLWPCCSEDGSHYPLDKFLSSRQCNWFT